MLALLYCLMVVGDGSAHATDMSCTERSCSKKYKCRRGLFGAPSYQKPITRLDTQACVCVCLCASVPCTHIEACEHVLGDLVARAYQRARSTRRAHGPCYHSIIFNQQRGESEVRSCGAHCESQRNQFLRVVSLSPILTWLCVCVARGG